MMVVMLCDAFDSSSVLHGLKPSVVKAPADAAADAAAAADAVADDVLLVVKLCLEVLSRPPHDPALPLQPLSSARVGRTPGELLGLPSWWWW